LNRIRAEQELSTVVGVVESAQLALYRAQEALGVLLVADGPVDASEEPRFEEAAAGTASDDVFRSRIDIRLFLAQQSAAERVLNDTRTEYRPYFEAILQPATTYPSQFFTPQNSWRFMTQLTMPLFDSGRRAGQRVERQAAVDRSRATVQEALTAAASEARVAREAVASTQRALASAQAAAAQAQEVVDIVNVSFRAGAATNIEVIDAERRARDADTQVAVAEDALRRARLELLIALGQFPR
jgi:outer membrane protein TolC